jgi:hypothetical protein
MFNKYSLNRMLVLFTTAGFAALLIDTTIEHWEDLSKEIMVIIPLIYSLIAIGIGVLAVIKWNEKIIRVFHIVLMLAFLVSAAGLYFHLEEDDENNENDEIKTEQMNKEEDDKPLFAPLAFAGLAAFGLLGTSKKWKAE